MKTCSLVLFLFLALITGSIIAQVPQGIPYQAVARDLQGQPLASRAVKVRFSVLDSTATGTAVYVETHATATTALGLFAVNVGMGTPVTGTFSGINWGVNSKFLKVDLDTTASGNNYVDLGTQQMMSVPYALRANSVNDSLYVLGDTLVFGNKRILIPGIGLLNNSSESINGPLILPNNSTCANQHISVSSCNGDTVINYNGVNYKIVEIFGQCWFKENLRTDFFREGTPINLIQTNNWSLTNLLAFCYYNNDTNLSRVYGNLYNSAIAMTDSVCPLGWHVSTDCDWMYLENALGMGLIDQQLNLARGFDEASALKDTSSIFWYNTTDTRPRNNVTCFSARASGLRAVDNTNLSFYSGINEQAAFWVKGDRGRPIVRILIYNSDMILRSTNYPPSWGMSIRCVKN